MLFGGITDFLNNTRQRIIRIEVARICEGAVSLDDETRLTDNFLRSSHSSFVKQHKVYDLGRHASIAWILKIELCDFRNHTSPFLARSLAKALDRFAPIIIPLP
jgi:hypothetical protein